jgi:hypothetical protein
MLAQQLQQLPWQVACVLFATLQLVSANIETSKSLTVNSFNYAGELYLQSSDRVVAGLEPLSRDATTRNVSSHG